MTPPLTPPLVLTLYNRTPIGIKWKVTLSFSWTSISHPN
jgi:hypothetical protein